MPDDLEPVNMLRDHLSENPGSTSNDSVVEKNGLPRSVVVLAGLGVVVGLGLFQLSGPATEQVAIQLPPTTTTVVPTTTATEPAVVDLDEYKPLPDRGGMRSIVQGWLTSRCDQIIDGPEPLLNNVYEQHLKCLEVELVKLDETCFLAARHYYQNPGDEALEVACSEPLSEDL